MDVRHKQTIRIVVTLAAVGLMLGGAGCLKQDDTLYFSDIYWFRTSPQSVKVDTSLKAALTDTVFIFRTPGLIYPAADSITVEVVKTKTTAPDSVYALLSPVIRFADADTLRSELRLTIHPKRLTRQDTVALRLNYAFVDNTPQNRRHNLLRLILVPVAPTTSTNTGTNTGTSTTTDGTAANE